MDNTKEIARGLGLLRTRKYSRCSSKVIKNVQEFSYLIVIDFESTCWQDDKRRPQEIIEFPCVFIDTMSGNVLSEFHEYVQPQESPVLSVFCRDLTGITQDQVDEGIPLYLCLKKFSRWLDELRRTKNISFDTDGVSKQEKCTFVTWSDWDLGVCLHFECQRKGISRPSELTNWIDLRATYCRYYGRRPRGLEGALKDVGITFTGRQHSGLDDARNTANLAHRMVKDGCHLKNTHIFKREKSPRNVSIVDKIESKDIFLYSPQSPKNKKVKCAKFNEVLSNGHADDRINIYNRITTEGFDFTGKRSPLGDISNYFCHKVNRRSISCIKNRNSNNDKSASCEKTNSEAGAVKPAESAATVGNTGSLRDVNMMNKICGVNMDNYTSRSNSFTNVNSETTLNRSSLSPAIMSQTPPLCHCDKRSKLCYVQTIGPNHGRAFFSCRNSRSSFGASSSGCGFFCWESQRHFPKHLGITPASCSKHIVTSLR